MTFIIIIIIIIITCVAHEHVRRLHQAQVRYSFSNNFILFTLLVNTLIGEYSYRRPTH